MMRSTLSLMSQLSACSHTLAGISFRVKLTVIFMGILSSLATDTALALRNLLRLRAGTGRAAARLRLGQFRVPSDTSVVRAQGMSLTMECQLYAQAAAADISHGQTRLAIVLTEEVELQNQPRYSVREQPNAPSLDYCGFRMNRITFWKNPSQAGTHRKLGRALIRTF
jgi:hypothetical protein